MFLSPLLLFSIHACRKGKRGLRTPFLKLSIGEQELSLSSYETMYVESHTFYVWVQKSDATNLVIDD